MSRGRGSGTGREPTAAAIADAVPGYDGQLAHVETIPAREAETVPAADHLPDRLADALGFDLYTHQAAALDALAAGEDVCLSTSTASGKTLVYALDIARRWLADGEDGTADGRTVGDVDGRTVGDVDGRTDGDVDGRTVGDVDGRTDGDVDGRTDGDVDGRTDGDVDGRTDGDVDGRLAGTTDGHPAGTPAGSDGATGEATALLVYPTKALSADQHAELTALYADLDLDIVVGRYDGDASHEEKRRVREEADVVITNFAGLNHYLSHHGTWAGVFRDLALVAIDEAHVYTGALGMHVAWIVRRLRRIVESDRYGARPRFVCTSATVGNPGEHAERLIGRPATVIDEDGSPRGEREVALWNPPTYLDDEGVRERRSTHLESSEVLAALTAMGHQTLMFAPSRKMTELDAMWTDERLAEAFGREDVRIEPYSAAHTKTERQGVEERLNRGAVDGVVSTTALEVGINVGSVDAAVLSGYPGSRMSFWQQLGRAGRGTDRALGILVAQHASLDQYVIEHPEFLFEAGVEDAVLDLENNRVYAQHVLAAAEELPLTERDTAYFGERLPEVVEMYRGLGTLVGDLRSQVAYSGRGRPQEAIDIYAAGGDDFAVVLRDGEDEGDGRSDSRAASDDSAGGESGERRTVDHVGANRAYREFHPGAIYLHRGRQYEVVDFREQDPEPRIVLEPVAVDYYTESRREAEVREVEATETIELETFRICWGPGTVRVYYPSYRKHEIHGNAVHGPFSTGFTDPVELHTRLCWIEFPDGVAREIHETYPWRVDEDDGTPGEGTGSADGQREPGDEATRDPGSAAGSDSGTDDDAGERAGSAPQDPFMGGMHAAEHAMIKLAPTELLIDSRDLGGLSTNLHPETGTPTLFVYDGADGGLGFTRRLFESIEPVLARTREVVAGCGCGVRGCPGCVMDAMCGNDNAPMHTAAAVDLLDRVLGEVRDGSNDDPS